MLFSDINKTCSPSLSKFAEKLEEIKFSEFYLLIAFQKLKFRAQVLIG